MQLKHSHIDKECSLCSSILVRLRTGQVSVVCTLSRTNHIDIPQYITFISPAGSALSALSFLFKLLMCCNQQFITAMPYLRLARAIPSPIGTMLSDMRSSRKMLSLNARKASVRLSLSCNNPHHLLIFVDACPSVNFARLAVVNFSFKSCHTCQVSSRN